MSWTAAITALEAHMLTAAPNHTQMGGEPGIPQRKTAAWFYTGSGDNDRIAETLTDHPFGEGVTVRFYWPVATRAAAPARTLEMDAREVTRALFAALEADRDLGGNVESLTINDATAGWLEADGAACRIVDVPLILGFTDTETVSR